MYLVKKDLVQTIITSQQCFFDLDTAVIIPDEDIEDWTSQQHASK